MANCYLCSVYLPKGEGIRVECSTGSRKSYSSGYFSLIPSRRYSGTFKSLRTLCPGCGAKQQLANENEAKFSFYRVLVVVGIILMFGMCLIMGQQK